MKEKPIQDAVHIYNAADLVDKGTPSTVEIAWSGDHAKVVLLIDDYPHAVFDFTSRKGFCRTGFPPPSSDTSWSIHGHVWNEEALELFQ
jgi:hypothetical protein